MKITSESLNSLRVGFTRIYAESLIGSKTYWERIAMLVRSTGKEEKYGWIGTSTKFREWLGDRQIQNLKEHDYAIKNKPFENTIGVKRDDIEDDSLGVYEPMLRQMGQDSAHHPDELIFALLVAGFSTPCFDGQYFFDTDHPVILADGSVGSYSNSGGGAGSPWFLMDTSKALKPLIFQKRQDYKFVSMQNETDQNVFMRREFLYGVDARVNVGFGLPQLAYGSKQTLDATNYAAARKTLLEMKGDGGKPLSIMPNLLLVGPSNEAAAKKLVMAERDAAGATNIYNGTAEVLVVPYLT